MSRPIAIRNAHPGLKVPRAAVRRALALLDTDFPLLPGDLAHLSLPRSRRQDLRSQLKRAKGKITGVLPPGELSLVFLTDPALAKIHADFMDDPTCTDVITFEGDPAAGLAGEICVSADTARRYVGAWFDRARGRRPATPLQEKPSAKNSSAQPQGPALQKNFAEELTLYLVHGWLHLCGYDDLVPAKKRRMRAAEKRCLAILRAADAIPTFQLKR